MYMHHPLKINISQVVHETIDGETILLNLETGYYYSLDQIGGVIWELVETDVCPNEIIEALKRHFPDQHNIIESSINHFIQELIQENLLVPQKDGTRGEDDRHDTQDLMTKFEDFKDSAYCPPVLNKYTDMQDLLQLDPIHEVREDTGWPTAKSEKQDSEIQN